MKHFSVNVSTTGTNYKYTHRYDTMREARKAYKEACDQIPEAYQYVCLRDHGIVVEYQATLAD